MLLRKKLLQLLNIKSFTILALVIFLFSTIISPRGPENSFHAAKKFLLLKNKNIFQIGDIPEGYVHKLDNLMRGVLVPAETIRDTAPDVINLGLVVVNTQFNGTNKPDFISDEFVYKTTYRMEMMLRLVGPRPLRFILVSDARSSSWAGQVLASVITSRLTLDIIQNRWYKWRKLDRLPPVSFYIVDSGLILDLNPGFIKGMMDNREVELKEKNKYSSSLFFVAPLYHLAFSGLSKVLFIDSSDLEFLVDIAEVYDEFEKLEEEKDAIMSLGLDLAPHYYNQLNRYRKANPETKLGSPGRFQGFNTGVVLYRLDRMRQSSVYNNYLNYQAVHNLTERFMFKISLAEQDFFTTLGFVHPELFHVLPCSYNKQESIQYMAPPFENIFELYHNCQQKNDIKVFHINGCGPSLDLCKHQGMLGSKYINDTSYHFLHVNMDVFWEPD